MDIPLPQEVPIALIPTPPIPLVNDQSIALPRPKITLKPSPSLRQLPLPSRPPVVLPQLASAPLYCNIPMPDEQIQPNLPLPPDDPNRYSPSTVLSDDESVVTSNTNSTAHSNRFLVLGKAQAKKRLLAFSSTKQAGGTGLTFNLPKKTPAVKQNLAKGFDPTTEGEQISTTFPVTKKKSLTRKVVKEDRARAVITAIEEIKREELLMRGVLRLRGEPKSLGDMTAPIPLLGQPLILDYDQVGITHKKERDNQVSESERDRKSDDRRKEKRSRTKSDHRSRDKEREHQRERERQSKPKEKANPPRTPSPTLVLPSLPVSWKEFRSSGMSLDQIRRSKIELESKMLKLHYTKSKDDKQKQAVDFEKEICNPLDYPSHFLEPFKVSGARQRSALYTQDMIRYTKCKPNLSYCINPEVPAARYRTRAEVMHHAKPASVSIMEWLINPREEVAKVEECVAIEKNTSRGWFESADKFMPAVLDEEISDKSTKMDVHLSLQTTAADSGICDGLKSANSQDDKMSSQVSTSDAFVSSGIVLSKWDSDYEDEEIMKESEDKHCTPDHSSMIVDVDSAVKERDSAGSDVISASDVSSAKYTEQEGKSKCSEKVVNERKYGSDVMSPDQSGLHTRPTSSGADSDPNLQNEYEEFMKSVTAGDDGDEVVGIAENAREEYGMGIVVSNKSESDVHSESNAEQSPPPKSAKKKSRPGYKLRKISNKESRTDKDKRKRKQKGKKKKCHQSSSTSSSSSADSSEEDHDAEEEHAKKVKKRKRKVRASKKKKYRKKTKKRRRKSTSSDEDCSSSESSTSSSSTSSEDSSSSSDHKKQSKKRKKPVKSKEKKSGQQSKKKKSGSKNKEIVKDIPESPKLLTLVKETKQSIKGKINHAHSDIKEEEPILSNVKCLAELDLLKEMEEPQNTNSIEKIIKKKSKKRDNLESDDEEETRLRKSEKKRRKYYKSASPVERKHHRSPSSSPDHGSAAAKRIQNNEKYKRDEHKSCENGVSQTGNMDNGKKSGKGEREHKAGDSEDVVKQAVTCVGFTEDIGLSEVDLPEPNRGSESVSLQLEQTEVDKLKNAAADVWENDSQLDESLVNSLTESNEWEQESPIVEKLPGHNKDGSSRWYKPGKDLASPLHEEANTAEDALNPPSLSDDLHQEVAKRSLRELKYLREVIKFEVGNEPSKQDSLSDGETEKAATTFERLNDSQASIAAPVSKNDKVTSFVEDFFKEPFLLTSVPLPDETVQTSSLTAELYSPGQEEDAKSTRSNSPEVLKLDTINLQPSLADDSDMSLGSTCSNQDIDVPNQRELLGNQWNDYESRSTSTNFCFPLDNIPLPPSAGDKSNSSYVDNNAAIINKKILPETVTFTNKLVEEQAVLGEITLPANSRKTLPKEIHEAPLTKTKHVITVKLLPSAKRLQSKSINVDVATVFPKEDIPTGWIPVAGPAPLVASLPSVTKVAAVPARRPSRWSDGPAITPVIAAASVAMLDDTASKRDNESTISSSIDIFADNSNIPVTVAQNADINTVTDIAKSCIAGDVKIEKEEFMDRPAYPGTVDADRLKEGDPSQRSCIADKVVAPGIIRGMENILSAKIEDKEAVQAEGSEFGSLSVAITNEKDSVRRADGVDGESSHRAEGGGRLERRDKDDSRKRDSRDRERDTKKRDVSDRSRNSNRNDINRDRKDDNRNRDGRHSSPSRDDRRRSQVDRPRGSGKEGDLRGVQESRSGSPRRKSLDRTERQKSPNRDDRNKSLNREEKVKSPSRDARTRSPTRDMRRRSPNRDNRHRSPARDGRGRSPIHDGRHRSPAKDTRNRSPNRDARNRSPNRDARHRSPNRDGRIRSPNRDGRNRSPNRDGRNRSPSKDGRNRSPNRDGRNRSLSGDGRRRDARKRSPNRERGTDNRDDSRSHDGKGTSRDRGRQRSGGFSPLRDQPLSNIPLPDLQYHGRDDCNSMDMEFSSPVSNFSPLVGLKRSLADSTTISDEELKLAHSGGRQLSRDGYGSINPDYYATVKVESNHHGSVHDAPNYESELSPKRLSLDERLELELGLRPSPKSEHQPPTLAPVQGRETQYQQHWPYQGSYNNQSDAQYPLPGPENYTSQQANQFASSQNAYFSQPPPQMNYQGNHNIPLISANTDNNNYVPQAQLHPGIVTISEQQHSALRPVPMHPGLSAVPEHSVLRPVQPVSIPENSFSVPSFSPDNFVMRPPGDDVMIRPPLPVPHPVATPGLPAVASARGNLVPIARVHCAQAVGSVISPIAYVQPTNTTAQPDLHASQLHPKLNVYSDLAKDPLLQLFCTAQLKETVVEPTLPIPALTTSQSPELLAAEKKVLAKKAAREKLRKEKEERRLQLENARLLKMEKFAKYKEAIQEEGDTLRRSVTLNLEEIRLNTGTPSVSRASKSKPVKAQVTSAVKVVPLPEATKGILISIGFREKPMCGGTETPRKSVMFADGVRPGDGSSPSAGEDLPSPVHFVPKKKLHKKKKKKIKVHVIRQVSFEESDEESELPPPPPPPGSPHPCLMPYMFPEPGKMFAPPPNYLALLRECRSAVVPAAEVAPAQAPPEWARGSVHGENVNCSYPDVKTMKLLAYHQAMLTIKAHSDAWHASHSPLPRGKPLTPPLSAKHASNQPSAAYELPNGFLPPPMVFGVVKTVYPHDRIPVVPCSSGLTAFPANAAYHLLPPPPLPQSPQLRNPPPPPPPTRNKGYRWPP